MIQVAPEYIYDYSEIEPKATKTGLKYWIIEEGTGKQIHAKLMCEVHYTGMLKGSGIIFDSSRKENVPFFTSVGVGRLIKGWDEFLPMVKIGTKAVLEVPPELGYGSQAMGNIPPNSTLIFHIHVTGRGITMPFTEEELRIIKNCIPEENKRTHGIIDANLKVLDQI